MANALLSQLTVPILVDSSIVNVTFDLKDAYARDMIAGMGDYMEWLGVTTTALTDGSTTNPITINGTSVTAKKGSMATYNGLEFGWNGSAWQAMGHSNFGALAFKNNANTSYTPSGNVSVNKGTDSTTIVNSITSVGSLPSFSVSGETLTFTQGSLPTKGNNQTVVTQSGSVSATFSGQQATITVE